MNRPWLVALFLSMAAASFAATPTPTPTITPVEATPSGVASSPLYPDGSALIYWNEDPNATLWDFYVWGKKGPSVDRNSAGITDNGATRFFRLTNLPLTKSSAVVTLRSWYTGASRPSAESNATTVTAYRVPFSYVAPVFNYQQITQVVQSLNLTPVAINLESYVGLSNTSEVTVGHDGTCVDIGWQLLNATQTPVIGAFHYLSATAMDYVIPHRGPGTILWLKAYQADCTSILGLAKENH